MQDYTPKTPLVLGVSPLTNRVYAYRGQKREDITEDFNRFTRPMKEQFEAQVKRIAALEKVAEALRMHLGLAAGASNNHDARAKAIASLANLDALDSKDERGAE